MLNWQFFNRNDLEKRKFFPSSPFIVGNILCMLNIFFSSLGYSHGKIFKENELIWNFMLLEMTFFIKTVFILLYLPLLKLTKKKRKLKFFLLSFSVFQNDCFWSLHENYKNENIFFKVIVKFEYCCLIMLCFLFIVYLKFSRFCLESLKEKFSCCFKLHGWTTSTYFTYCLWYIIFLF